VAHPISKQTLWDIKIQIDPKAVIVVISISHSHQYIIHPDKKMNKKTSELNHPIEQMGLTDIYSILQQLWNTHSQQPMEVSLKQITF
jgi:hypothetical protein